MKYPFYKPASLNPEKLIKYIDGIDDRRHFTNNGPLVRELTEKLQEWLGVERLLLVSSGTVALQVAYKALNIKGAAYTTPISFVATTSALRWLGVDPFFSDIAPDTLNLDPARLTLQPLQPGDVAVATHLYGNPCDVMGFERIAHNSGLKVIYDASHAFATRYSGKNVLGFGDASAISFHATKLFHTVEGGAITLATEESYQRARSMINFGFSEGQNVANALGINAKMSELHAAVGLVGLDELEDVLDKRFALQALYRARLEPCGVLFIHAHPDTDCTPSYMPIILDSPRQRDQLHQLLLQEGIETRKYFESLLSKLPYANNKGVRLPVAQQYEDRVLCLPLYPDLSERDIMYISEKVLMLLPRCKS